MTKQKAIGVVLSQLSPHLLESLSDDCTELDVWYSLWALAEDTVDEINDANRPPPVPTCPNCTRTFLEHGATCNSFHLTFNQMFARLGPCLDRWNAITGKP